MPEQFTVPLAAQRAAGRALATHRQFSGVEGVTGLSVAERLIGGTVDAETIATLHRFFLRHTTAYTGALNRLQSEETNGLVRSWALHGAEMGQAFANSHYHRLVREGKLPDDPMAALFELTPEQVYGRFQAGAWRWEYGLTPRTAAEFVHYYHAKHDQSLNLTKAFGESSSMAVANQLHRRFHTPTPFEIARKALKIDDWSLQQAAQADLAAFHKNPEGLTEAALPWQKLHNTSAKLAAQDSWPTLMAYLILAVEEPKLLVDLNKSSTKIPTLAQKPKHWNQYHDAINVWLMYFHPEGQRYHDSKLSNVKKYQTLEVDLELYMWRAFKGKKLHAPKLKTLMRVARDWVHANKGEKKTFAGTFHILINYWKKGAWAEILEALPLDTDVRSAFEQFVKQNKMPEGGVELSQKLATNSPEHKEIAKKLQPGTEQMSLSGTKTAKAALKVGTPLGVKSVVQDENEKAVVLSAVRLKHGTIEIIVRLDDGTLTSWDDDAFAAEIMHGDTTVVQAHAELPGSGYGVLPTLATTAPAVPTIDPSLFGTQEAADYVLDKMKGLPVAKEDDPQFTVPLGAQIEAAAKKHITVVGYARKNTLAQYIVKNMSGTLKGVSPSLFKKWVNAAGGIVGYDKATIDALIPPPEVGITITPALKSWLESAMPGGYTLLTPQGTAFAQAAKAKGWKVQFGQEWMRDGLSLTLVAFAMEEGHDKLHAVFTQTSTGTITSLWDVKAAGHVTQGVLVPAGQVDTPATSDATAPKIPANAIGTPQAKAFAEKFNMTLVTKAYSPLFKADLGGLYQRTDAQDHFVHVIGYARNTNGVTPQLVLALVKADEPSEAEPYPTSAEKFNAEHTGPLSHSQGLIDSLLTVAKPNLPTGITGTTKAQAWADDMGTALTLPWSGAKHQIGTMVQYGAYVLTVVGYTEESYWDAGTLKHDPSYVVTDASQKSPWSINAKSVETGKQVGTDPDVLDDGYVTAQGAKVSDQQVQQAKDAAQPPAPKPPQADPWDLIKSEFPNVWKTFIKELSAYGTTSFGKAMKQAHNFKLVAGSQFKNTKNNKVFTIQSAFRVTEETEGISDGEEFVYGPGTLFVYALPDGTLTSDDSGDLAEGVKEGLLVPALAGDLDAQAQQNKIDAQTPDAQAKALGIDAEGKWPNEDEILAVAAAAHVEDAQIIAAQDIDADVPGDKFNTALAVGSMWVMPHFDAPVEVLGAYMWEGPDGEDITMLVFRAPDGTPQDMSASTVQNLFNKGQMHPATQAAPKAAPTELPTPYATEEELDELADLPEWFTTQITTPQPGAEDAQLVGDPEDVNGNQVPLGDTPWAKAAKTFKWTVAKGDKWEWITYEESGNTVLTIMGAIDLGEHAPDYYILVEEAGTATYYRDAKLREALYAQRLFPWNVLPSLDEDAKKMLASKNLADAAQIPLSLTLFGVAAGYQGFEDFAVPGADWQYAGGGQPYTLLGAVEAQAGYLLIVRTAHGKPYFQNDLTWANYVEENNLEPVGVPTTVTLPFEQAAMDYILKDFSAKVFQVKGVELDSLSVAFAAKKAGFAYTEGAEWYRVGVDSKPFTIQGAFSLTGGAVYVLVQYPDGKYASFTANQQEQQLLIGLLLPGDVTGLTELSENAQSFVQSKFGLTDAELAKAAVPLQYTQSAKSVLSHGSGWELPHGSVWVWPSTVKQVAVLGALVGDDGAVHLIIRDAALKDAPGETGFSTHPDKAFAEDVQVGGLIPLSEFTPPKFNANDLLLYAGQPHLVLAYAQKAYLLQSLFMSAAATPLKEVAQSTLEDGTSVLNTDVSSDQLFDTANYEAGLTALQPGEKPETWPEDGATVQIGATKGVYVGGLRSHTDAEAQYAVLLVQKTADFYSTPITYHALVLYKGTLFKPISSSYADLGISVDTPVELAGIQGAFDYATSQNYKVAAKSESPDFQFHLGEIRTSKANETRIVAGYAFDGTTPSYILASNMELSSFTQKGAAKGHDQYGPHTGLHPDVRNHMLPKPGTTAPVIPVVPDPVVVTKQQKVTPGALPDAISVAEYFSPGEAPPVLAPKPPTATYPISDRANAWMKKLAGTEEDWGVAGFVEPPPNARFHTYTTAADGILRYTKVSGTTVPAKVLGWVYSKDLGYRCVLDVDPSKPVRRYKLLTAEQLGLRAWADSEHTQVIGDAEGGVTITDNPADGEVHIEMPGLSLPHDPGPAWEYPAPISQPAMDLQTTVLHGKSVAAGCVAILPAGTRITGGGKSYESESPMVMLVHPRNKFGGPLSFPKGRVDKGEGLTRAAVREVWEETGVKVKPVDMLRNFTKGKPHKDHASQPDWTGTTTVTRYYIGYIVGGHPQRFGWEADSVTFKPLPFKGVEETQWYKKLSTRDRAVVQKVVWWLKENGSPQHFNGQAAPFDVQVTDVTDADGKALPATKADPWLPLIQHAPFPVTEGVLTELRAVSTVAGAPTAIVAGVSGGPTLPTVGSVGSLDGEAGFTCLGYVGWESEKGSQRRVLFHGPGGVFSQPVDAVAEEWKADAAATALAKSEADQGWFWSTDPERNHILREIATGTLGDIEAEFGLSLALFRQWLTEAGVPFAEAVEPRDMVRVAALFTPEGLSKIERDNLLEHLYRKALLHGAGAAGTTPLVTSEGVSVGESSVEPALAVLDLPYFAEEKKALVASVSKTIDVMEPATDWTYIGGLKTKEGGSKPVHEAQAPDGTMWVFKPHDELQRPVADRAAYEISELLKPNNNPVGLIKLPGAPHGGVGSVQPLINGRILKANASDTFDDQDIAEVLSQHVVDMFLGDHDGHEGNWLRTKNADGSKGPLVAIDKGQSFKFAVFKIQGKTIAGQDPTEAIDPFDATWQSAPGNHGVHMAKRMLRGWLTDGAMPETAIRAMQQTLNKMTDISDAQLQQMLAPVAKANKLTAPQTKKLYEMYRQRRDTMKDEWRAILRQHLGADWNWPGEAITPTVVKPKKKTLLDRTPEEMGFTKADATYIADAVDAQWAGKSLAMDRDAIENQNVVVKMVTAKTGTSTGPGTLIHWRVPKHAGVRAAKRLYPKASVTETPTYTSKGPTLSKIDDHFRLYYRIHLAADNLDFAASSGYVEGKPPAFNEAYFALAEQVSMELDKLDVATQDPSGWYTVGDGDDAFSEPNVIVQQLIAHLRLQLTKLTSARGQVEEGSFLMPVPPGSILKTYIPFQWTDDGTHVAPDAAPAKPVAYDVTYATGNARWPNIVPDTGGALTLQSSLTAPAKTLAYSMPQFVISHGPLAIHFAPPHDDWREEVDAKGYGVSNVKAWEGVCWAFIPGTPNSSLVARAMNLWQDATGIETKKPAPADRDILWLMKQAQAAQTIQRGGVYDITKKGESTPTLSFASGVNYTGLVVLARKGTTTRVLMPSDYEFLDLQVTLKKPLKPGEKLVVSYPQPVKPNSDDEAINAPDVQAAWDLYKGLDTLSPSEQDQRRTEIVTKLTGFVSETVGMTPKAVAQAMADDREGRYDRQRVQQAFDAETVSEGESEGTTQFSAKLAVPKGTQIAPGSITLTFRIGATVVYVQDQYEEAKGKWGTLYGKKLDPDGKVIPDNPKSHSLNYQTGVISCTLSGKIKTDPAPRVEFFVTGTPTDGVQLGVGIRHHTRLGWDRAALKTLLVGKKGQTPVFVGHRTVALSGLWSKMLQNGALLANYLRPMYGVPITGSSKESDIQGGATGTFACIRKGVSQRDALFFDLDLLRRTDIYTAGSGDEYGKVNRPSYRGPEVWAANNLHKKTDTITISSPFQFLLRDAIDLRDYLVFAVVDSEATAKSLIKQSYDHGWTSFWRGRPPEEVIVTLDGAKARYKDVL